MNGGRPLNNSNQTEASLSYYSSNLFMCMAAVHHRRFQLLCYIFFNSFPGKTMFAEEAAVIDGLKFHEDYSYEYMCIINEATNANFMLMPTIETRNYARVSVWSSTVRHFPLRWIKSWSGVRIISNK